MQDNKSIKRPSIKDLTWQDVEQLKNYTTETGKLLPRRITRFTAQEQRHFTKIVKRARNFLLMP